MALFRVLAVAFLVLTAGCGSTTINEPTASPSSEGSMETTTSLPNSGPVASATAAETSQRDTSPTKSPGDTARSTASSPTPPEGVEFQSAENPWGRVPIIVGIENQANPERSVGPLIDQALAYWNEEGSGYARYEARFIRVESARQPDVILRFTGEVTCNGAATAIGCAPVLTRDHRITDPVIVEVEAGYSDETTETVAKHEFGHLLGIGHNESPMPLMAPRTTTITQPLPNATDRSLPWLHPNLTVAIDLSNVSADERDRYQQQVIHALDYYDTGAEGHVPENVSFGSGAATETADIVISFPSEPPCQLQAGQGSCSSRLGMDPDGDGAVEYFTRVRIAITGVDRERIGWHVGYWLGFAFGAEHAEDLPPPFDQPEQDPREDWWTT